MGSVFFLGPDPMLPLLVRLAPAGSMYLDHNRIAPICPDYLGEIVKKNMPVVVVAKGQHFPLKRVYVCMYSYAVGVVFLLT